jgi:hypothetical protein
MSNKKPDCFGDDTQYAETSRICNGCGWRWDCKREVNAGVNRPAAWGSTPTRRTSQTNATNGSLEPITVGKAMLAAGHSPYNHGKELAPQFFKYLGYSVMEVTLEEGLNLVRSARTHYATENMKGLDLVLPVDDKEKG